jgi:hypothetical protein
MTPADDRFPDMLSSTQFDAAIERVLRGDAVGDDVGRLARFVDDMRVMADRAPPPPSPELAALLADRAVECGAPAGASSPPRHRSGAQTRSTQPRSRRSHTAGMRMRVAAFGVAGKVALILAFAATAAAGGATGILPEPASHFVRRAIEVLTPFELPDDATASTGRTAHAEGKAGVTPGGEQSEAAAPRAGPRPAAIGREAGQIETRSLDFGPATTGDDPPPMSPTADTSNWVSGPATTDTSPAQGPKSHISHPTGPVSDPADAPPPHGEPFANPGPNEGGVPPGHSPSKDPHPVGSPPIGSPPAEAGSAQDRPHGGRPAKPNGPPPVPGAPGGGPSDSVVPASHRERPPGIGQGSSGGQAPTGPDQAGPRDTSKGARPDDVLCGEPCQGESPAATTGPAAGCRTGPPRSSAEGPPPSDGQPGDRR